MKKSKGQSKKALKKKKTNKSSNNIEKFTNPGRGPLARKVISLARLYSGRKIISLKDWKMIKQNAAQIQKTVVLPENLKDHDPVHACYAMAQNQLSVMIEQLADLPELDKLTDVYESSDDEYMPEGPPMSPLTRSYFFCWGAFDLSVGKVVKESLASVLIDFCRFRNVNEELLALFEKMNASRMGIYRHEGVDNKFVTLRELVTNKVVKTISPSGYLGRKGEIWYVRVLPPPFDIDPFNYSTIFATPYILCNDATVVDANGIIEDSWMEYFGRNLKRTKIRDEVQAYEYLMKYGLRSNYWNEYIFLAYRGNTHDAIRLSGIPDIASSLPHSDSYAGT